MSANFTKVVRLGTVDVGQKTPASVYCKITFLNGKLSITGVEGPLPSGNCRGGCGQIEMHLSADKFEEFAPGWNSQAVQKFLDIWDRYHLNDMRAGNAAQESYLRNRYAKCGEEYKRNPNGYALSKGYKSHCDMVNHWLDNAGLLVNNGYRYGTAWKREEVPADVLDWLQSLPEADKIPAWV